jgi:DUF971 family protein
MRPADFQLIGRELAVRWDDGSESYIPLERLRQACPCAGCKGEVDIMGNIFKNPEKPLTAKALELARLGWVGAYAIQLAWADGHDAGIYSFEYLRRIADAK